MDFYYCDHVTMWLHTGAYYQVHYHHNTPMKNDIITPTEQRTIQNSHAIIFVSITIVQNV